MRAIIFANGRLDPPMPIALQPGDVIIAADGGAAHCLALGLRPDVVIGDFDSLANDTLAALESQGAHILRYPQRKDFTDLELALQHALQLGASQALVLGALGLRWDQTLANLMLPAAQGLEGLSIRMLDGPQEISLLRGGSSLELCGQAGDTISLIPTGGDAHGVTTEGLEYPLAGETLYFGATRGVSNVLLNQRATVWLEQGLLLCVVIHQRGQKPPC